MKARPELTDLTWDHPVWVDDDNFPNLRASFATRGRVSPGARGGPRREVAERILVGCTRRGLARWGPRRPLVGEMWVIEGRPAPVPLGGGFMLKGPHNARWVDGRSARGGGEKHTGPNCGSLETRSPGKKTASTFGARVSGNRCRSPSAGLMGFRLAAPVGPLRVGDCGYRRTMLTFNVGRADGRFAAREGGRTMAPQTVFRPAGPPVFNGPLSKTGATFRLYTQLGNICATSKRVKEGSGVTSKTTVGGWLCVLELFAAVPGSERGEWLPDAPLVAHRCRMSVA